MERLRIRRLGYALGAEVTGVDLKLPLDPAVVAEIRKAWLDHIVLCFPRQRLSDEQFLTFAGTLGNLDDNRATPHLRHPDAPALVVLTNKPLVVKEHTYGGSIANYWHTDNSYTRQPTTATFLNAQVIPDVGGDTMFASMYAAYESLSPAFREMIDDLEGVHDVSLSASFRNKRDSRRSKRSANAARRRSSIPWFACTRRPAAKRSSSAAAFAILWG